MKFLRLLAGFLSAVVLSLSISAHAAGPQYHWSNLQHVDFQDFDPYLRNKDVYPDTFLSDVTIDRNDERLMRPGPEWQDSQIKKWKIGIRLAAALLPENLIEGLVGKFSRPITFLFYIDRTGWNTGHADDKRGLIHINLLPSSKKPSWLTWEAIPEHGFTLEEIMALALHEIGHLYCPEGQKFDSFYADGFLKAGEERPPTLYGERDKGEDCADSFILYMMYPKELKFFKKRYSIIKDDLGIEYERAFFSMPASLSTKLAAKK